jgi:hypothetical protein
MLKQQQAFFSIRFRVTLCAGIILVYFRFCGFPARGVRRRSSVVSLSGPGYLLSKYYLAGVEKCCI